jgi:hypothetical protein
VRIAHATTYYDSAVYTSTDVPYDGNPTTTLTYTADAPMTAAYQRAQATFDGYGRPLTVTPPNQAGVATPKRTTYSYAPASGVPVDGVTVTNPAGHVSVTYPSRVHGPDKVKDANGKYTHLGYDAFNRLTKVWLPSEGGAATAPTGNPSMRYSYPASMTGPNVTTTAARVLSETLQSGTTYLQSYEYVDGFGRTRETQTPSPYLAGTRMVSVTTYDERGLVAGTSPPQYNTSAPGSGLLNPVTSALTSYVHTLYDSLERPVAVIQDGAGAEAWRTTSTYLGDKTVVHPPVGGTTETSSDVFGRTTKVAEYTTATAHQDTLYAYTYPATGPLVTTITDPAGKASVFTTDMYRHAVLSPVEGDGQLARLESGECATTWSPAARADIQPSRRSSRLTAPRSMWTRCRRGSFSCRRVLACRGSSTSTACSTSRAAFRVVLAPGPRTSTLRSPPAGRRTFPSLGRRTSSTVSTCSWPAGTSRCAG